MLGELLVIVGRLPPYLDSPVTRVPRYKAVKDIRQFVTPSRLITALPLPDTGGVPAKVLPFIQ